MKRATLAIGLLLVIAPPTRGQTQAEFIQSYSIPQLAEQTVVRGKQSQAYLLSYHINTFYLRGDFNGDGRADCAVLVVQRSSGKKGIAIVHGGSKAVHVVGAGNATGNGGDDFSFIDYWYVYDRGPVRRGVGERGIPRLSGDAVLIGAAESSSALLYWNGRRYVWYQQGD